MRRLGPVLVVIALLASACGANAVETDPGEDSLETLETTTTTGPPTTTAPPTTTTVEPSTTTTMPSDPLDGLDFQYSDPEMIPVVRIIDAGAEPRAVRMWNPQVGSTTAIAVITTVEAQQEIGGTVIPTEFSATIEADVEVVAVTDEGYTTLSRFTGSSADAADPVARAAIESAYEALIGTEVFQITRPDGAILAEAGLEDIAGNVLDSGLGSASSPLPTEPIGVGAVWETDQVIDTEGVRIIQTIRTTLVDVIDDQLFIEIEGVVSLDPDSPALVGAGSFTLEGTTTGSAVWDLNLGMASSSVAESTQVVRGGADAETTFVATTLTRVEIETNSLD